MAVSETVLKWALRFYPPLFFQRIWVRKFKKGFYGAHVKISRSIFNKNYNGSIFGGTIFAAVDPFYPVLFHQLFSHKGYRVIAWSKSAEVQYIKPANSNLYFDIELTDSDIAEAEEILNSEGKYIKIYPVDIYDDQHEVCAMVSCEVYLRNLNYIDYANNNE